MQGQDPSVKAGTQRVRKPLRTVEEAGAEDAAASRICSEAGDEIARNTRCRLYGMRWLTSSTRGRGLLYTAVLSLGFAAASCGGTAKQGAEPTPALAGSQAAQLSFRSLKLDWFAATPRERAKIEPRLRSFLRRFPEDDKSRLARVLLAWTHVYQGDLNAARVELEQVAEGPAGSVRDFAIVAQGASLVQQAKHEEALALLLPLRGKIVDPHERLLFSEQLVLAAIGAKQYADAVDYLVDWIAYAPRDDRQAVQRASHLLLQRFPAKALSGPLIELDRKAAQGVEQPARETARDFVRKHIREHLTDVALQHEDDKLARALLETAAPAFRASETGLALLRLGRVESGRPRVLGRSIGLVMSLSSAQLRNRSAAVAAGMSRALRLSHADAAARPRLVVRDDAGGVEDALAELTATGAALIVGGVDEQSARGIANYAASAQIAAVLLWPVSPAASSDNVFLLGADPERPEEILRTMAARSGRSWAVLDGEKAGCGVGANVAGQSPLLEWLRQAGPKATVHLAMGASCAMSVGRELERMKSPPLPALGLECAEVGSQLSLDHFVVEAGDFPTQTGRAGWFEVLGHDAALLAEEALRDFPNIEVQSTPEVARLHARARGALAAAEAELWSTSASGFAGKRTIERRFRARRVTLP